MFCSISFELLDTYICALVWFIFLLHFIRHTFYISGKQKKEILHHCHHFYSHLFTVTWIYIR